MTDVVRHELCITSFKYLQFATEKIRFNDNQYINKISEYVSKNYDFFKQNAQQSTYKNIDFMI